MTASGAFSADLSGLTPGTLYFFRAKATGAGMVYSSESAVTTGATPDVTPPGTLQVTVHCISAAATTKVHAVWSSTDDESGIVEYSCAAGRSAGDKEVVDWTCAGTVTEIVITGLSLTPGQAYYVSVKALNGQGLWSEVGSSDGITVSTSYAGRVPFWVWILMAVGVMETGAIGIVVLARRSPKAV